MPIDFPSSPTTNQIYSYNNRSWVWNGSAWLSAQPSGSLGNIFSSGRLTLESGVPVSTSDQTSKTTIYYTPYNGNMINLYDGSNWSSYVFTQRSLSLGTLTSGKNYDVFLYNNSGTLTLELSSAWTSDTVRANALSIQDGIYVKSDATTRRYLGTFRTTSTTTTEDSITKRFVWNLNNQVHRPLHKLSNASHTYTTAAWRNWNNDATLRVEIVTGIERSVEVHWGGANATAYGSSGAAWDGATPGYDSTDLLGRAGRAYSSRGYFLGYHYCQMQEYGTASTTHYEGRLEGSFLC